MITLHEIMQEMIANHVIKQYLHTHSQLQISSIIPVSRIRAISLTINQATHQSVTRYKQA